MGRGIAAAIPVVFRPDGHFGFDKKYFTAGFLDNYDVSENDGEKEYIIKSDLLLDNYRQFLAEFYDLIDVDFRKETDLAPNAVPDASSLDEFMQKFDDRKRNGRVPCIDKHSIGFSTLGCDCDVYWLFYRGSYKALLEEYTTLLHFEKILAKTMKNPLANAIKFGIYG